MSDQKTFAGLTWQQISFIFVFATPMLTIQTMVLDLRAENRQTKFERKIENDNKTLVREVNNSFDDVVKSIDNVYSFSDEGLL